MKQLITRNPTDNEKATEEKITKSHHIITNAKTRDTPVSSTWRLDTIIKGIIILWNL